MLLTGNCLTPESLALRNLEVVAELQIVGEIEGVSYCHISKAFKEVHLLMLNAKIRVCDQLLTAKAFPGCHAPPMNSARTLNSTSMPVVAKMIPVGIVKRIARARPKKTVPTLVLVGHPATEAMPKATPTSYIALVNATMLLQRTYVEY